MMLNNEIIAIVKFSTPLICIFEQSKYTIPKERRLTMCLC